MKSQDQNPLTKAVYESLACAALILLVVLLIALTSCTACPHEECPTFPTAAPRL